MKRYASDGFGSLALEFLDQFGERILPDWDSSLYVEFYDSTDTLKFTATTSSTPPLEQDTDDEGDFVKVQNINLTGWALGHVTAKVYSKYSGEEIQPYPFMVTAFYIYLAGFAGAYAIPEDVIVYSGVRKDDLDQETDDDLKGLLLQWLIEAMDMINQYCQMEWTPTPVTDAPASVVQVNYRIVANMVGEAQERRKQYIGRLGDFTVKLVDDLVFTDELKKTLDRVLKQLRTSADEWIDIAVAYEEEEEE